MKSTDQIKSLQSYLKSLHAKPPAELADSCPESPEWADAITHQLVYSFLLWRATSKQAQTAMKRLIDSVVDFNELRICLPHELVEIIGPRHPHAEERVIRMRATLNDVYSREHTIGLSRLATIGKRDAKTLLDELDGIPGFVTARVALLSLGGHAFPVDERVLALLQSEGVFDNSATPESAASWLERQIRAGEAESAYLLTEKRLAARPSTRPAKTKKKTAKKGTSTKATPKKAAGTKSKKQRAG